MRLLCALIGHRWRVLLSMPGFWVDDPDMFDVQQCSRCGKNRMAPPGWEGP